MKGDSISVVPRWRVFLRWGIEEAYRQAADSLIGSQNDGRASDLTETIDRFIERNSSVWPPLQESSAEGTVLIDGTIGHPGHLVMQGIVARTVSEKERVRGLILVRAGSSDVARRVLPSYGFEDFLELDDRMGALDFLRSAIGIYHSLEDVQDRWDLLKLAAEGTSIGRLAYDSYLRSTGEGTVEDIKPALFRQLLLAETYRRTFSKLFEEYDIRYLVTGETMYAFWGTLVETALQAGSIVLQRKGTAHHATVRRYTSVEEIENYALRPTEAQVRTLEEYAPESSAAAGMKKIRERVQPRARSTSDPDRNRAFGEGTVRLDRDHLASDLKPNQDSPLVAVLPHVMIDGVQQGGWSVFPDYLTWYRRTLEKACELDDVTWLVKPHPSEQVFDTVQTAEGEYWSIAEGCDHVRLLPSNVNTHDLIEAVDGLVTVRGTAGIEFSCHGVPTLIAAKGPYSGFGFTVEPQTPEEYVAALRQLPDEQLSEEQIHRARRVAYLYFDLLGEDCRLWPSHSPQKDIDAERFWQKASSAIQDANPWEDPFVKALERQLEHGHTHLTRWDRGARLLYPELQATDRAKMRER